MKLLVALFLVFAACSSRADLAVICTAGGAAGKSPSSCTSQKYDVPTATDLVRKGKGWTDPTAPFVLTPFGQVGAGDPIEVCQTVVTPGTISPIPYTSADPCKSFAVVPASTVGAVNRTGTITISWTKPDFGATNATPETQLTGYRLYSGVKGSPLTLNRALPLSPLTVPLPGYGAGKYSFALSAVYGDIESAQTGPVDVEVVIADPTVPKSPASLSITSVTISF